MIHLFDWKILPIRFAWIICFLCMYIRKFTKYTNVYRYIYIYICTCVCVCVCVHVSERLPIKLCCNLLLGGLHAPYFWSSMICNHFLQTKWRLLAKWRLILPICFHKLLDTAVWRAAVYNYAVDTLKPALCAPRSGRCKRICEVRGVLQEAFGASAAPTLMQLYKPRRVASVNASDQQYKIFLTNSCPSMLTFHSSLSCSNIF